MRSLTFCAICLLAVAAGLAVYEANFLLLRVR